MKFILTTSFLLFLSASIFANQNDSTTANVLPQRFSFHAQTTVITQYKPKFAAQYSGANSLQTNEETQTSITSSLFATTRLWKNANFIFNPEIAGGSGLSSALGVASSTNGETFRIGSADPKLYVARLAFRQLFSLDKKYNKQISSPNQLAGEVPKKYISITIGKISLCDYFDVNSFSHDPRKQFTSWGLMNNGAFDYAANTRGYTPSFIVERVSEKDEWRYAFSMVPVVANGGEMNSQIAKANAQTIEFAHHFQWKQKSGAIRLMSFLTNTDMGNYNQIVQQSPINPDITLNRMYCRTKYGFFLNAEQWLTSSVGIFLRAGWNDGQNETWHFTEIDQSFSAGVSGNGKKWKRNDDTWGAAIAISGISKAHQNYLKAGGKGFMLGDGNLSYGLENVLETYYSCSLMSNYLFLSVFYQLVVNPGYNTVRGPVNVFSVRFHYEL